MLSFQNSKFCDEFVKVIVVFSENMMSMMADTVKNIIQVFVRTQKIKEKKVKVNSSSFYQHCNGQVVTKNVK